MKLSQLIKNENGRYSTTGFIQFFSWLVVTALLAYAVMTEKPYVDDWFLFYGGFFVFGSPATKGVVSIFKQHQQEKPPDD